MSNVILKNNASGLYFKDGLGFNVKQAEATRLGEVEASSRQACARSMGYGDTSLEAVSNKSFGVAYVRQTDLSSGSVNANAKNPSRRRFATREEAQTHGNRFNVRKASYGAAPGSAGHVGFYVVETNDPVNAAINPKSGLTIPANGAPRTYAERMAAKAAKN